MHQDHGQSPDVCKGAINLGFTSVMMDGSLEADGKTIASYDYNVDVTRKVVDMAHTLGVTVEGELGCLGSLETMKGDKEDGHGTDATMTREQLLTDPEQAADFVKRTQLDALAIAIGTSHGAYKFTRKPTGDILAIDRIKEIHRRIPNTHLVMHGSSSVPQELLAIIRQYGGNMKETYGVPVEEIQEAIKHGVRKINIDTDIRLAMTGAVRKFLAENPDKFDARDWLKPAREAAKADLQAALHRVRLRRPGRQDQGRYAAGGRDPVRQGRAGASREATDSRCCDSPVARSRATRPVCFLAPLHDLCPAHLLHHLAAAARARQGARQLRRRQRPHPDGGQRPPVGLRRDHGRADSRQGRAAHPDGAVLVRASWATCAPTT